MKKIGLLLVCVFMLVCLLVGALHVTKREEESPIENAGLSQNAAVEPESLLYNGEEYPMRAHLQTVLLIGTDSTEGYQEQHRLKMGSRPSTTTIRRTSLPWWSWTPRRALPRSSS